MVGGWVRGSKSKESKGKCSSKFSWNPRVEERWEKGEGGNRRRERKRRGRTEN